MAESTDAVRMLEVAEQAASVGDLVTADRLLRDVARTQEAELGPVHPELANTLNNLGIVAERIGRPRDAEAFYRRAAAIAAESLPEGHPAIAASWQNLEDFCFASGLSIDAPAFMRTSAKEAELGLDAFAREDEADAASSVTEARHEDVVPNVTPSTRPDIAPLVVAPQNAVPQDIAPKDTAPKDVASKEMPPQEAPRMEAAPIDLSVPLDDARFTDVTPMEPSLSEPSLSEYSLSEPPLSEAPLGEVPLSEAAPLSPEALRIDALHAAQAHEPVASRPLDRDPLPVRPRGVSPSPGLMAIGVAMLLTVALLATRSWSPRLISTLAETATPTSLRSATPAPAPAAPPNTATPRASAPTDIDRTTITEESIAPAPSASGVSLVTVQLCQGFAPSGSTWRCDPIGDTAAAGQIAFYTRVRSARDGAVVHRWYRGDTLVKAVKLTTRANAVEGYRTYSRQVVNADDDWRVEVTTVNGDLLHQQRFLVR